MKVMKEAQKSMKKQFDKKRRNPQELKVGEQEYPFESTLKEAG